MPMFSDEEVVLDILIEPNMIDVCRQLLLAVGYEEDEDRKNVTGAFAECFMVYDGDHPVFARRVPTIRIMDHANNISSPGDKGRAWDSKHVVRLEVANPYQVLSRVEETIDLLSCGKKASVKESKKKHKPHVIKFGYMNLKIEVSLEELLDI